ncbi:unnamed protein product [Cuscuta europaea]|uniref:Zinc knuckle CX2CX4HX4C domain-containing protein n=1 Tax=Cuscuta europaea TaxID=41803 RepID=A0A9P1E7N7_CUSEU|nr:unnamed protein product [Cuscuta europaea]
MDTSLELPQKIWIGNGATGFFQNILYEKLPLFSHTCSRFGHSFSECPRSQSQVLQTGKSTAVPTVKIPVAPICNNTKDTTVPVLIPVTAPTSTTVNVVTALCDSHSDATIAASLSCDAPVAGGCAPVTDEFFGISIAENAVIEHPSPL